MQSTCDHSVLAATIKLFGTALYTSLLPVLPSNNQQSLYADILSVSIWGNIAGIMLIILAVLP